MVVYIIVQNRNKYKKNIEALCEKSGIKDYIILDPEFDEIKKPFPAILCMGIKPQGLISQMIWELTPPDSSLSPEKKRIILESFKEIAKELKNNEVKFKKTDIPDEESLIDFLNKYKGQVFELRLKDGRFIGIYPDKEKLLGKYPIEYHASTIININKIMSTFSPEEIIIKET